MVAVRAFFAFLLAQSFFTSVVAGGLFETRSSKTTQLEARQNAADVDLCARVDLALLGISIARGVCLCVEAGVLTPASLTELNTQVTANSGLLAPILNLVGGLTGAVTRLASNLLPTLVRQPVTCRYPENSFPNACGSCAYECKPGFVACGSFCVATGTTCVSGIPQQRRSMIRGLRDHRCPTGAEACEIPGFTSGSKAFECVNTASDLESCGGCQQPSLGQVAGQDCTQLPNVSDVMCQQGQCIVAACDKGYKLQNNACVEDARAGRLSGYWAALEQAEKIALGY